MRPRTFTECPHNKNKKLKLPCLNLGCVACIAQSAKLYCSALLGEKSFFFIYILFFCENKKGTVGGVAGISQSADLYCSLLLCFTSALLYPAVGRSTSPVFFPFFLNPLGLVLQLERERESCLLATLGGAGEGRANLEEEEKRKM